MMFNICDLIDSSNLDTELQRLRLISSKKDDLTLIKYDKKNVSYDNISSYGLFRSLIFKGNKLLSFAPPKSHSVLPIMKENKFVYEDFIDGTMINVFHDGNTWRLATRSIIDADTSFYISADSATQREYTFKDMFYEALHVSNMKLDKLDYRYCYSFVLQHPKNRIVTPIHQIQLYLVAAYSIDENNNVQTVEIRNNPEIEIMFRKTTVMIPLQYNFPSLHDAIQVFASSKTSYIIQGVVIYCGGKRFKMRNGNYNYVRKLRGNQAKLQYHYYCLLKENKVNEFLYYYPELQKQFNMIQNELNTFTMNLLNEYVNCFIKKQIQHSACSNQFKQHLYNLHGLYINYCTQINVNVVLNYINQLDPAQLMHSVNYVKR